MAELNDIQFSILDSLYFVEEFDTIVSESGAPEAIVADELKNLIHQQLVQVMRYDNDAGDYVKSVIYDTDDMRAYQYLATKEGLLRHNGH